MEKQSKIGNVLYGYLCRKAGMELSNRLKYGYVECPNFCHSLMPFRGIEFVYILVKSEDVIYVGVSNILDKRLMSHAIDKDFDSIYFIAAKDREQVFEFETELIKILDPKLNIAKKYKCV